MDPAVVGADEWDTSMRGLIKQEGLGGGPLGKQGATSTPADRPRKVRDPKTGRTGTLPAGEPLPAGLVVVQ